MTAQPSASDRRRRVLFIGLMAAFAPAVSFAENAPFSVQTMDPQVANAKEGVDYRILDPRSPSTHLAGSKIQVIEYFGYWCPHCNVFEPTMNAWQAANSDRVQVIHIPVAFRGDQIGLVRLYYALDAMGIEPAYRARVFAAIHVDRTLPPNADVGQLVAWASRAGIDKTAFGDAIRSPIVDAQVVAAAQHLKDDRVSGVPELVIDGHYAMTPDAQRIRLADALVKRVEAEQAATKQKPASSRAK